VKRLIAWALAMSLTACPNLLPAQSTPEAKPESMQESPPDSTQLAEFGPFTRAELGEILRLSNKAALDVALPKAVLALRLEFEPRLAEAEARAGLEKVRADGEEKREKTALASLGRIKGAAGWALVAGTALGAALFVLGVITGARAD